MTVETQEALDLGTALVAIEDDQRKAQERAAAAQERTADSLDVLPEVVGRVIGEAVREVMFPFSQAVTGLVGKDGAAGKDGLPGKDGIDGKDGADGLSIEGRAGADGRDGIDGKDGVPGKDGKDGAPGAKGDTGLTGPAGTDGARGVAGLPGGGGSGGLRLSANGEKVRASTLDLQGAGVSVAVIDKVAVATFSGTGSGSGLPPGGSVGQVVTNTAPGAGDWETPATLTVSDEGTPLDTAVSSLDFTGAGVTASVVGHAVTVDIASGTPITDTFTGDGAQTTFTLSQTATGTWGIAAVNGAQLLPSEFAVSGTSVVFDVAPALAAEVAVTYVWGGGLSGGAGAASAAPLAFPFTFDTPWLAPGVPVYVPTPGDILEQGWIVVTEAWDGTTPKGDFGTAAGTTNGFLKVAVASRNMTDADDEAGGTGLLINKDATSITTGELGQRGTGFGQFTDSLPIYVWVTQNGLMAGADPGSSQGAGILYLRVSRPTVTTFVAPAPTLLAAYDFSDAGSVTLNTGTIAAQGLASVLGSGYAALPSQYGVDWTPLYGPNLNGHNALALPSATDSLFNGDSLGPVYAPVDFIVAKLTELDGSGRQLIGHATFGASAGDEARIVTWDDAGTPRWGALFGLAGSTTTRTTAAPVDTGLHVFAIDLGATNPGIYIDGTLWPWTDVDPAGWVGRDTLYVSVDLALGTDGYLLAGTYGEIRIYSAGADIAAISAALLAKWS